MRLFPLTFCLLNLFSYSRRCCQVFLWVSLYLFWWCCVEPFSVLVDGVEGSGVYCWNCGSLMVKVLSTVLYYSGLSYRVVAKVLRDSAKFTYVCPPVV
jgi:hypothetical protein